MLGFEHGIKRIVSEIIGGTITSTIIVNLVMSGLLNPEWLLLFKIINMPSIIVLAYIMVYWATAYLTGWLIGLIILAETGLVGPIDFIVYFGVPLVILVYGIYKKSV